MGFRARNRSLSLSSPGRVLLALLALLVPLAVSAGAGAAHAVPPPPVTWTVHVGNQTRDMAIQGERFLPGDITIDQGDTVKWKANSAEPHTVTFFPHGYAQSSIAPFNPGDPSQNAQVGGNTYDGTSYFNSGVLSTLASISVLPAPTVQSYSLTFPNSVAPGTYTYYCLVHGVMMRGEIHLQAAGTPYPATQADYNAEASFLGKAIIADGKALRDRANALATRRKVLMGPDDGTAMVMRFLHRKVVVHKGDTVRFLNTMSAGAPHTVTFGKEPVGPAILSPYGDPTKYKGGKLNSGIIPPQGKFAVTFKKAGKFHYVCMLHHDLGMKGVVVVKP